MSRRNSACVLLTLSVGGVAAVVFWLARGDTQLPAVLSKDLLAEGVHEFALAPDGQQIVFCDAHGLKRLSLKTGQQEAVLPLPSRNSLCQIRCLAWRPDMSCIAFVKNASAEHIKTPRGYTEQELVVLDWGSKATHVIDRAPDIFDVAWSPDGKQVAWVKSEGSWERAQPAPRLHETGRLLAVSPAEGEKLRPKVLYRQSGAYSTLTSVRWTPDGRFLVLKFGGARRLGVLQPDGSRMSWVSPPGRFPLHGAFAVFGWDISPDSSTLAFGFGSDLWVYSLSNLQSPKFRISTEGILVGVRWSPDGKGLLYVAPVPGAGKPPAPGSAATAPPHALHRVDGGGKEHRVILQEERGIRSLQWAKGNEIFYLSGQSLIRVVFR